MVVVVTPPTVDEGPFDVVLAPEEVSAVGGLGNVAGGLGS
jgi:hypothetical protein